MSKPIYTPKQVAQILDAANKTMRKYADYQREDWKPVETALTLLTSLKDGKVEIKEIETVPVRFTFRSRTELEAKINKLWEGAAAAEWARNNGWQDCLSRK